MSHSKLRARPEQLVLRIVSMRRVSISWSSVWARLEMWRALVLQRATLHRPCLDAAVLIRGQSSLYETMVNKQKLTEYKLEQMKRMQEEAELKECTFKPVTQIAGPFSRGGLGPKRPNKGKAAAVYQPNAAHSQHANLLDTQQVRGRKYHRGEVASWRVTGACRARFADRKSMRNMAWTGAVPLRCAVWLSLGFRKRRSRIDQINLS